jgi:hypothetical protein
MSDSHDQDREIRLHRAESHRGRAAGMIAGLPLDDTATLDTELLLSIAHSVLGLLEIELARENWRTFR